MEAGREGGQEGGRELTSAEVDVILTRISANVELTFFYERKIVEGASQVPIAIILARIDITIGLSKSPIIRLITPKSNGIKYSL